MLDAREYPRRRRNRDQQYRHPKGHPVDKADLDAQLLFDQPRRDGIGGGADQRAQPAERSRKGNAHHQSTRHAVGFLFTDAARRDHRQCYRCHDQRGRGVGNPHRQERRRRHEGEQQSETAFPRQPQQRQRHPLVHTRPLNRECKECAAQQQEQDWRIIFLRGLGSSQHPHQRQCEEG